jgi:hypothetical protein
MKYVFIILLVFFLQSDLFSQPNDTLRSKYNNQTLYRCGGYFLKGNERLTYKELSREFSMSDLGLAGYEKSRKLKTTATIFRFLSLAAGIASVSVAAKGQNRDLAYGLLAGQFATMYAAMRYSSLSMQSLDRAIWQRNKDVLFPVRQ